MTYLTCSIIWKDQIIISKKKFFTVKNWFSKNPVFGDVWANVIVIFGISIVDNLRPTISHWKSDLSVSSVPSSAWYCCAIFADFHPPPSRLQAIDNRLHTTLTNTYDLINEKRCWHTAEYSDLLAELFKQNDEY
jgi:hypothetical protein